MSSLYQPIDHAQVQKSPKVIAATTGAGAGTGLAALIAWILGEFGVDMPVEVAIALAGLLITAITWVAGYMKPDPLRGEIYGEVVAPNDEARPGEVVD